MSLIASLLALVAIPLKARIPALPVAPPKEVDNRALADEVRRLQFALDYWRRAATALMDENERLRDRAMQLEAQLQDARAQLDPTSPYFRRHTDRERNAQNVALAQQMLAQQHHQHHNQMAQNTYPQNLQNSRYPQLGMQNGWPDCTCVPDRAHALTRDFNRGGL